MCGRVGEGVGGGGGGPDETTSGSIVHLYVEEKRKRSTGLRRLTCVGVSSVEPGKALYVETFARSPLPDESKFPVLLRRHQENEQASARDKGQVE